jgi:hypothetical protein
LQKQAQENTEKNGKTFFPCSLFCLFIKESSGILKKLDDFDMIILENLYCNADSFAFAEEENS